MTVAGLLMWGFSLTRGRVYRLQMLLALASAVILGSESRGTRDHILLSQIWDFPFRCLLGLAGLSWKYSTPPPHGIVQSHTYMWQYKDAVRTSQETHYFSITKTHRLVLFREVIAAYCENHMEHINTLCEQNVETLYIRIQSVPRRKHITSP
jgi:hypothetical protein